MFSKKEGYIQVPNGSDEALSLRRQSQRSRWVASVVLLALCSLLSGFIGHRVADMEHSTDCNPKEIGYLPLNSFEYTFKYNISFSEQPTEHTNAAWRSLFPADGGYFMNPQRPDSWSTFSVYHQLHCLDVMRGSFYAHRNAALKGELLRDEDLPESMNQHHTRHCFDFIRQALMCNADTTLEVVDDEAKGVRGFGTTHQCRDMMQLQKWVEIEQNKYGGA